MKFKVPVAWTMVGSIIVDADTKEKAIEYVNSSACGLPFNGEYLKDSFEVDGDIDSIEVVDDSFTDDEEDIVGESLTDSDDQMEQKERFDD